MLEYINKEILLSEKRGKSEIIETIYFGGGTPGLLSIEELKTLLDSVYKCFKVSPDVEITLEANPDNIKKDTLLQWKQAGINRLSVGIQTFVEDELTWMNRSHTALQSLQCIDDIISAGYSNFSVDLIYGSPLLNNAGLKKNVDILFKKNVPHISCYALTVEPKTALETMIIQKTSKPVNSEQQSEQFLLLMDWMKEAGYEHYEISNFAKPGMRSRHNSSYWQGLPYYGFGPSAHSFDGNEKRKWNVANNSLYIKSLHQNIIPFTEEVLTTTQQLNEYIMISLRTSEGINISKVTNYGVEYKMKIMDRSQKYLAGGKLFYEDGMLKLTNAGKLLADGISADLFFV